MQTMQLWERLWAVEMLARISRPQPQRELAAGAVWQWRRPVLFIDVFDAPQGRGGMGSAAGGGGPQQQRPPQGLC